MRKLLSNKKGSADFILAAIVAAIAFGVGILIVWNVLGSFSIADLESDVGSAVYGNSSSSNIRPVENTTNSLNSNLETFFVVAPIVLIIIAAVGIISYVLILRRQ